MASPQGLRRSESDLSGLLEVLQQAHIKLDVSLTQSDEVQALRLRIASLEASLEAEKAIRVRAENLFAAESYLNNQLIDLCRDAGVAVPDYYFKR